MTLQLFLAALVALVAGLAFCFWGYRVFLIMLPVFGFLAGFWAGGEFWRLIFGEGFLATTTSWIVGLIIGLIGLVFSYMFYSMGVVFVAAVIGAGIGSGIMTALGLTSPVLVLTVAIIAAVIAAFLTWRYNLQRPAIMGLTAVLGAALLTLAPLLLFGQVSLEQLRLAGSALSPVLTSGLVWTLIFLALAVAGFFIQQQRHRNFRFGKADYVEVWG